MHQCLPLQRVALAEPVKCEAEEPTKPTRCSVLSAPWTHTCSPQMFQVLRIVAGERILSTARPCAEAGRAMTNVIHG